MLLNNVEPFVRFADILPFATVRGPHKTYDARLIYVMSGGGIFISEGIETPLEHRTLITFQPDTLYKIVPAPKVELAVFDFDYTNEYCDETQFLLPYIPSDFEAKNSHGKIEFSDAPLFNSVIRINEIKAIEANILEIIKEFKERRIYFQEKSSLKFKELLFDIARYTHSDNKLYKVAEKVIAFIENNYNEPITNKTIGEVLSYNPNYLNRVMVAQLGIGIREYILKYRISIAAKLLLSTDMSATEIAEKTGFCSLSHFSRQFIRFIGYSPSKYRHLR